ncbi:hypothetical protein EV702DRAFT_1048457 [Suillus placidus]|uniref:Uncharacterized protein n=1 Tax=Suillus placidus TaxID=48579 RepID=A0A9P6ZPK9_9AGAM|nr:hypothetical protein EV702DRAFT_1048457 [Suillus placidus]
MIIKLPTEIRGEKHSGRRCRLFAYKSAATSYRSINGHPLPSQLARISSKSPPPLTLTTQLLLNIRKAGEAEEQTSSIIAPGLPNLGLGHKTWHNRSNDQGIDSQCFPAVIRHRSFIYRTLARSLALMYGIYYHLMFATFPHSKITFNMRTNLEILRPDLFSGVYHVSTRLAGLTYLGIGVGFLSAIIFGVKL